MIVDTSALVAVFRKEPECARIIDLLDRSSRTRISAATIVELTAVIIGKGGERPLQEISRLLGGWGIETVPFDAEQTVLAQTAYMNYGRGSRHPAKLNMGDCYSYALAKATDESLLFVGDDFTHTDVRSAL